MIGQAERLINLKSLEKVKPENHHKKIISFASGKGGTGKTFVSLSIAYFLSQLNKKVLFIDFDLNFANANILLNIIPKVSIKNFLKGNKLFEEVITKYNDNLHLIFGASGELDSEENELKEDLVLSLFNHLNNLKENYDIIIFDTAAGGQRGLLKVLTLSDISVIVASPEPTAVMDGYVMVKLLNKAKYKGGKFFLINKSLNEEEAIAAFNNIKAASEYFLKEKIEYLGFINFNEAVYRSIADQELLVASNPASETSMKIKTLAASLINKIEFRIPAVL